jgi:hypothetical protein
MGEASRPRPAQRVPPHSAEAEEALLGAMLLTREALAEGLAHATADDLYRPAHARLFAAMGALHARGEPVDPVTLRAEMRPADLEGLGGAGALVSLMAACPSTSGAWRYAGIVARAAARRRAIAALAEATEAAYAGDDEGAYAALEAAADGLSGGTGRALAYEDVAAVLRGEVDPLVPTILRRSDGVALVYPGLLHWLMGDPGKGKTWVALHATAEVLADGGTAVYLDWEGNRRIIGSRLAALGLTADVVGRGLLYLRPPYITGDIVSSLAREVADRGAELVVCDGVAKALQRQGYNEDSAPDVVAWLGLVADPLTEAGAAVLCLDHMAKDPDGRGLWARGSGAKLAEVSGAAWVIRPRRPYSRGQAGRIDLVQAKDREGQVGADGAVDPPAPLAQTPSGRARRTGYMERVSRALEQPAAGVGVSRRWIEDNARGKREFVREAIDALVEEGHVRVVHVGQTMHHHLARPYREDGDPGPSEPVENDEFQPEEMF